MSDRAQKLTSNEVKPEDRAARLPEVMHLTQKSKTMIYNGMREGTFPSGFVLSSRARAWMLSDVMAYLKKQSGGAV